MYSRRNKVDRRRLLINVSPDCFNGNILQQLRARKRYSAVGSEHSKGNSASKRQIADKLGCHPQQIYRWERYPYAKDCNAAPNLKFFKRICLLYQVDPMTLLGLKWIGKELAQDYTKEVEVEFCPFCGSYKGDINEVPNKWEVKSEKKKAFKR